MILVKRYSWVFWEVSKLSSFLQYCASEAKIRCKGRKLSHSNDKTKKRNKIWFSTELLNLKKEIKQLAYALRTTPYDKAKLAHFHSKKSIYKKMVKRIKRQHEQSIINKLTSLEKADPQKFWHLFNQLKDLDRAHKSNPITPSEWVSHFENLLNIQPNIENSLKQRVDRMLNSNACNLFNELNFKITLKELSQAASPGGVLPMWWVIDMCRGFDPLFSLWQDRARSFWGVFSHPPTQKRSFEYKSSQNSIFLAPKYHFSLDLFGSNFQWPAAHPQQFSDRVPPPGGGLPAQEGQILRNWWHHQWDDSV